MNVNYNDMERLGVLDPVSLAALFGLIGTGAAGIAGVSSAVIKKRAADTQAKTALQTVQSQSNTQIALAQQADAARIEEEKNRHRFYTNVALIGGGVIVGTSLLVIIARKRKRR